MRKPIIALLLSLSFMSNMTISNAQSYKVFIDAGHGGKDNGSSYGARIEDNLNLQISEKVEKLLREEGIYVETTRNKDEYVSLSKRTKKSNLSNSDLFISIHQNTSESKSANGIETYYYDKTNKGLANIFQSNLLNSTKANDRGVKKGNLQVLRDNNKPSILIECGFISNDNEGFKLSTKAYQEKIANGIVNSVKEFFNIKGSFSNIKTVLNDNVKVRAERGTLFAPIGYLQKGDKVKIVDTKHDWHKIKFGNTYGYVSSVYVK